MSSQIIPDILPPVNESAKIIPARLVCVRCSAPVRQPLMLLHLAGRTYSSIGGIVIIDPTRPPVVYCAACAADLRVCSFCGCTDECACEGGCSWVQEDVCSACAPNAHPATDTVEGDEPSERELHASWEADRMAMESIEAEIIFDALQAEDEASAPC